MCQFTAEADLHETLGVQHGGSKSFSGTDVDVVNVPLHKGRQLIKWRPK
jgi:hypothetical protein